MKEKFELGSFVVVMIIAIFTFGADNYVDSLHDKYVGNCYVRTFPDRAILVFDAKLSHVVAFDYISRKPLTISYDLLDESYMPISCGH